ncbi:unnamed protein product [Chondrus crispus]|uniref:Uncharacterized protein n=1 Tax=Chondrus crispus TaxID=2769 RepID=R7QLW0_CHOCR|nr:unnamed protein product [Chondrus crispus]CDF38380.1 unnamed protein product [Chondrus crispus]|eukprot:XP_005718265.1 unnamed protein product [Chondrus crispus]
MQQFFLPTPSLSLLRMLQKINRGHLHDKTSFVIHECAEGKMSGHELFQCMYKGCP